MSTPCTDGDTIGMAANSLKQKCYCIESNIYKSYNKSLVYGKTVIVTMLFRLVWMCLHLPASCESGNVYDQFTCKLVYSPVYPCI